MRLIDADRIADYMRRLLQVAEDRLSDEDTDEYLHDTYMARWNERYECLALIENAPTVDAVPREEYERLEKEYEGLKAETNRLLDNLQDVR